MSLFYRIWGRGYSDKVSIFLFINALTITLAAKFLAPIPHIDTIGFIYLSLVFLLLSKRYKIISILTFELWGIGKMGFAYFRYRDVYVSTMLKFLYGLAGYFGTYEGIVLDGNIPLINGLVSVMVMMFHGFVIVAYAVAIMIVFFIISIGIDYKFKVRKRLGLK